MTGKNGCHECGTLRLVTGLKPAEPVKARLLSVPQRAPPPDTAGAVEVFPCPAIRPAGHCPYVHHRHNSCNPVCPGQVRCTSAVSHSQTPSRFHQPAHLKADTRACPSAAPDCSSHHAPSGHCDLMATPHRISGCKGWSWWKCPAAVHLNRSALWPDGRV